MQTLINVGVAQLAVVANPTVIRTILGSCIGICIYDRNKKIGGMAHILLPQAPKKIMLEKYADTAIPFLLEKLYKQGCQKEFMSAKIAGGAAMFKFNSNFTLAQIGERNIEISKKVLDLNRIPLLVEDVGGCLGRVIDFFLLDGRLKVRAGGKEKVYYKV